MPIKVFSLMEVDGGGMGYDVSRIATYRTETQAENAGRKLGHAFWRIKQQFAIEVDDTYYLLQQEQPIKIIG